MPPIPTRHRPALALRLGCLLLALPACAASSADVVMHEALEAQLAGEARKAIPRYRRAIALKPKVDGAWNNLGLIALAQGRLTEAIKLLEEELSLHPRSPEARFNLALVLLQLERTDDAIARIEGLAAADGGAPTTRPARRLEQDRARVVLALARWQAAGAPEEVARPLELVLSPAPADPAQRAEVEADARRVLAWHEAARGEWEAVLSATAASWPGHEAERRRLRAHALLRRGQAAEASALLAQPDEADEPDDLEGRVLLAHGLTSQGRPAEAREALGALESEDEGAPSLIAAHRLLASLEAAETRWAEALTHLDRAVALSASPNEGLWLDQATALAHLGRLDEARLVVAGVLRDHPDSARASALRESLR